MAGHWLLEVRAQAPSSGRWPLSGAGGLPAHLTYRLTKDHDTVELFSVGLSCKWWVEHVGVGNA